MSVSSCKLLSLAEITVRRILRFSFASVNVTELLVSFRFKSNGAASVPSYIDGEYQAAGSSTFSTAYSPVGELAVKLRGSIECVVKFAES